jgi:hypothetical protein
MPAPRAYASDVDILLAEDLLLLLLDDDSGKLTAPTYLDTGIGGALLMELALAGCVELRQGAGRGARAKVVAIDAPPSEDPLLVESMAQVRAKERTARDLVARLGKKRREVLLDRLRQRGVLIEHADRVLGLIPRHRWPTVDSTHENAVRREIGDLLVRGGRAEPRTVALVALLSALDLAHKVLELQGLSGRDVRKHAKQVEDGDWVAEAVRDSIAATQGAVAAVT